MVQALFMLVFVSVILPVIFQLIREKEKLDGRLASGGPVTKVILAIAFLAFGVSQSGFVATLGPIDLINNAVLGYLVGIPVHETGHFLFMPLGDMPCVLGGSLFQFAFPATLAAYFLSGQFPYLGSIFLFLTGHALINIGDYMKTAHAPGSILLLSLEQDPKNHDWLRLFEYANLLPYDEEIGMFTRLLGMALIVLATVGLFALTGSNQDEPEERLIVAGAAPKPPLDSD